MATARPMPGYKAMENRNKAAKDTFEFSAEGLRAFTMDNNQITKKTWTAEKRKNMVNMCNEIIAKTSPKHQASHFTTKVQSKFMVLLIPHSGSRFLTFRRALVPTYI